MSPSWVTDKNVSLLTDLYELTMLQAYFDREFDEQAVFSLFCRRLPQGRNYLIAAGLEDVLDYLENLHFDEKSLKAIKETGKFSHKFLDSLKDFRFQGDVWAVREGTPVFAGEPLLEIKAPISQAQLVETFVMNQIHLQTVLASKASRMVDAARGKSVVDFGLRRMHGADAGLKSARAFWIAGLSATSNVLAGHLYDIPITGTMAHSFIQSHDSEIEAFKNFMNSYPETVLLVDTYDTKKGVEKVIQLSRELGENFQVKGIRLDSGNLVSLSFEARKMLDEAGLGHLQILASGGLSEQKIDRILSAGAPIDGFGVGTGLGVSADAPSLDFAYKLTSYAGKDRVKSSSAKVTLPGQKQIFRRESDGKVYEDELGGFEENLEGRPLLKKVMNKGEKTDEGRISLEDLRKYCLKEKSLFPESLRQVTSESQFPVRISLELQHRYDKALNQVSE